MDNIGAILNGSKTASDVWLKLLDEVYYRGALVSPRGLKSKEILANTTVVDMRFPVVTNKDRDLGYRFMAAEAHWILSGNNKLKDIQPYSSIIDTFSDDGVFFFGAYGPRIVDQLTYIVDSLYRDQNTRQAVLTIWRPNPRESRDIPCTISVQWIIRDNTIHCIDTMRSSDVWLGWPYDVFNFSMLTGYIMLLLKRKIELEKLKLYIDLGTHDIPISLGNLYLTAGSQHLYETNWKAASKITHEANAFTYMEFDPLSFRDENDLLDHLEKGLLPDILNDQR